MLYSVYSSPSNHPWQTSSIDGTLISVPTWSNIKHCGSKRVLSKRIGLSRRISHSSIPNENQITPQKQMGVQWARFSRPAARWHIQSFRKSEPSAVHLSTITYKQRDRFAYIPCSAPNYQAIHVLSCQIHRDQQNIPPQMNPRTESRISFHTQHLQAPLIKPSSQLGDRAH